MPIPGRQPDLLRAEVALDRPLVCEVEEADMKRVLLLALLIVSTVELALERERIFLVLALLAVVSLLYTGVPRGPFSPR